MNNLIRSTVRCLRLSSSVYPPRQVDGRNVSLSTLQSSARLMCSAPLQKDLGDMVKKDKVVVFMKGTPAQPMCGFSNAVVQILRMHGVTEYAAYNDFSNWPTIPQIFLNGEFVGGCDILLQMHQNGDLVEELQKLGIRSALLDSENESK
ncbi:unnamed protein product [Coregonus sp. 'balchen']|nr:unnamed protein product [Coregonus sp. 'balchen']